MHVLVKPALRIVLSLGLLMTVIGWGVSHRWFVQVRLPPVLILLTPDGWVMAAPNGFGPDFIVRPANESLHNPYFFQARHESGPALYVDGVSVGGAAVNVFRGRSVRSHATIGVRHWTGITIVSVALAVFTAVDRRRKLQSASCSETSAGNDD